MPSDKTIKNLADKKSAQAIENQTENFLNENSIRQIFSHLQKDFVWFSSLKEQIDFCSEGISTVLGYKESDVKSFNEKRISITFNEDVPKLREAINEFLTDPQLNEVKLEYRIGRKDNSFMPVKEIIHAERDENGEVKNLFGILTDITEAKESEERFYGIINDLQKLNEAKDKFVSRISHDLRSPFTSIIGFAEVLMNDNAIPEKDKSEYLSFIFQSSKRLLNYVNQLTEIIKLQTFRTKLEPQRSNTNRLIHYSVASFTAQVVDKNLEIKVNVNESIYINVDERLFLLLISSLISNSVKFSKPGGRIIVSAQDFNEDFIEITLKDEGVGISEKNKNKLFKMDQIFYSEGTRGEKGAGLGLLLSKEIVEKHGGNIWFYSNQNEGTEFHFTLPVAKNSIMIVAAELASRSNYEGIVKKNFPEFDLLSAKDGYDALSMISNRIPSIIILEHNLPLMTGLQMLENIITTSKNSKILAMVIADNPTDDLVASYKNIGVDVILSKPVSAKVLNKPLVEMISLLK